MSSDGRNCCILSQSWRKPGSSRSAPAPVLNVKGPSLPRSGPSGLLTQPQHDKRSIGRDETNLGKFSVILLLLRRYNRQTLLLKAEYLYVPLRASGQSLFAASSCRAPCVCVCVRQVVGVKDSRMGEEVCACIKLMDGQGCTEEELKAYCKGQVSRNPFKYSVMSWNSFYFLSKCLNDSALRLPLPLLRSDGSLQDSSLRTLRHQLPAHCYWKGNFPNPAANIAHVFLNLYE